MTIVWRVTKTAGYDQTTSHGKLFLMMQKPTSYGAWIHEPPGMRSTTRATFERRMIGGIDVIALISLSRNLAKPALAGIKDGFSQL